MAGKIRGVGTRTARQKLYRSPRRLRKPAETYLLVEGKVVIEVKAVERINPVHLAQVISYLELTGCPAGLLMNFNSTTLRAGLKRLDHPDIYVRKHPPSESGANARSDPPDR